MPNYKGHLVGSGITFFIIFGIGTFFLPSNILSPSEKVICLGMCLLGSLFPDIDTRSVGQKIFYSLLGFIMIMLIYQQQLVIATLIGTISILPLIARHRGFSHRLWFIVTLPFIMPLSLSHLSRVWAHRALAWYVFFFVGALSHLVLDFGFRNFIRRTLHR